MNEYEKVKEEIERKFGKRWWDKKFYIDRIHSEKFKNRGLPEEKIKEMLGRGVKTDNIKREGSYLSIFKDGSKFWTIVFFPTKPINFIISGYSSHQDEIRIFKNMRKRR